MSAMTERMLNTPQRLALRDLELPWQKYWNNRATPDKKYEYSFILGRNIAKNVGCNLYDINKAIFEFTKEQDRQELLVFLTSNILNLTNSNEEILEHARSLMALKYEYHLEDARSVLQETGILNFMVN